MAEHHDPISVTTDLMWQLSRSNEHDTLLHYPLKPPHPQTPDQTRPLIHSLFPVHRHNRQPDPTRRLLLITHMLTLHNLVQRDTLYSRHPLAFERHIEHQ
jgi:hypothetical protein